VLRVFVLLSALVPSLAGAQQSELRARAHFAEAQKRYDAGSYEGALDEYKKSYELTPYPAILYFVDPAEGVFRKLR